MKLRDETLMAVGMISLTLSVILRVFFDVSYMGFSVTDFLEGVLVGISMTTNLAYLVRRRLAQDGSNVTLHDEVEKKLVII